tara:strand:- start:225 stop:500 length:276 start_codon:yes stop_codon:yes gene_type:complete
MRTEVNVNTGKTAFFVSLISLGLTFSIVYFSIEKGGVPFPVIVGWFCFLVFIVGSGLSLRAVALGHKTMGILAILISILHLPLFAAFRHVI